MGSIGDGYIEACGLRLHYVEWGNSDAPHVLLVHGWDGTARLWDLVAPFLESDYHVVAVTLRGRGKSDRDPTGEYSFDQYAADLWDATKNLGMKELVFVGGSLGGMVGQSYAAQHPEQVRGLVSVDIGAQIIRQGADRPPVPSPLLNPPEEFDNLQQAEAWLRQLDHLARVDQTSMDIALRELFQKTSSGGWVWASDVRLRELQRERPTDELFPHQWHTLSNILCPTLIIRGGRSRTLLPEVAERSLRELPNGALVEVPDCGHWPYFERPMEFRILLRGFLGEIA
jgi:esterase